ncbi:hypothetical protein AB0D37_07320 [Streptomyces sp. NPDC048384]|uniref:hypothetical protein n=1 Tax=Streptomyces sp. NPDC048384 TaxID=3155487 RepID=UPI00341DBF84
MLPLIAGLLGRTAATSAVTGTAARSAVTSAASSGAISAGTTSAAGNSGRVLSTMQFGTAAARALDNGSNAAPAQAPATADDLGWARS